MPLAPDVIETAAMPSAAHELGSAGVPEPRESRKSHLQDLRARSPIAPGTRPVTPNEVAGRVPQQR